VEASSANSEYHDVVSRVAGIVFIGTPFRGSSAASAADVRVTLARWRGAAATDLLINDLKTKNGKLQELVETFYNLVHNPEAPIPIQCFCETGTTNIARAILPRSIANQLGPYVEYVVSVSSGKCQ
jgi:hypothetical protein